MADACNVENREMSTTACMHAKRTGKQTPATERRQQAPGASSHQPKKDGVGKRSVSTTNANEHRLRVRGHMQEGKSRRTR